MEERLPLQERLEEIRKAMELEVLSQPLEDYLGWLLDIREIPEKMSRKGQVTEKLKKLKSESLDGLERKKQELQDRQDEKKSQVVKLQETIWNYQKEIEKLQEEVLQAETGIMEQRRKLEGETERYEQEFQKYLAGRKSVNYEYLKRQRLSDLYPMRKAEEAAYQKLVEERGSYVRSYPNRTFSTAIRDNRPYDELLENLQCDELETFREAAKEQAEKKEEEEEKLENIKEEKEEQEELTKTIQESSSEQAKLQDEIKKIMQEAELLEEDMKGLAVDGFM